MSSGTREAFEADYASYAGIETSQVSAMWDGNFYQEQGPRDAWHGFQVGVAHGQVEVEADYVRIIAAGDQVHRKQMAELKAENERLACNLRGKHETSGATYTHLVAERDSARNAHDALLSELPRILLERDEARELLRLLSDMLGGPPYYTPTTVDRAVARARALLANAPAWREQEMTVIVKPGELAYEKSAKLSGKMRAALDAVKVAE